MDLYSCISILTLFTVALGLWKFRKPKECHYSLLDASGVILNTVLMVMIYPPLCILSGLMATGEYIDRFPILLEGAAVALTRLLPAACVGGIGASIVLRRRRRSVLSFAVQFTGAVWFGMIILLAS